MACCAPKVIVFSTINGGGGGTGDITTANLVSTVNGLGTAGYISSLSGDATVGQLTSTTTGIYNFVSSFIFPTELTSSLVGLASMGYVSTSQLVSTVAGLNTGGGGGLSDVVYFISTASFNTGVTLWSSNTSNNVTSNTSEVPIPFTYNLSNIQVRVFPETTLGTDYFNLTTHELSIDTTPNVRTYPFFVNFSTIPVVHITPHVTINPEIPIITAMTTTGMDYGIYNILTSNYTETQAHITTNGLYENKTVIYSSNYDGGTHSGGAASNFGSFITPGNFRPDVPASISWYFDYSYNAGLGPEYGTVINLDPSNINNLVAYSWQTFPPGGGAGTFTSTLNLSLNLSTSSQYYVWWYIAYPEAMGQITSDLTIDYTPYF